MASKNRRRRFITARVGTSILPALILYSICTAVYDDLYFRGIEDSHFDYFGGWDEFYFTAAACAGLFLIALLFIWRIFNLKWRFIAAGFIAILIIGSAVFNEHQKNLLEIYEQEGGWAEEINLTKYEPFCENTLAKTLDGESSLSLQNNLPRLDGATALYPLYASFVQAAYPMAEYKAYGENSSVICSRTSEAFNNLLNGTADAAFLMGVSESQLEQADQLGLELRLTPIGKEAFIFFVNKRNPASNLSVEDIAGIYSGQIRNWREIGGSRSRIRAYQRPEASGSQIMLKEIMGDVPIIEISRKDIFNEMMGMYMAVAYRNHRNSIGYSFLFYIRDMIAENEIKFLSINGVPPTAANIAGGSYPFAHDFYAVTIVREPETEEDAERISNTDKLIDWILSSQGQSLVEKTGYVPLR